MNKIIKTIGKTTFRHLSETNKKRVFKILETYPINAIFRNLEAIIGQLGNQLKVQEKLKNESIFFKSPIL